MLHEKDFPKNLWVEAASTRVFFLHRLPTGVLNKRNPFEDYTSTKFENNDYLFSAALRLNAFLKNAVAFL